MAREANTATMLTLAGEIFGQTYQLEKFMKEKSIKEPSLAVGASTELWSSHTTEIATAQTSILDLTKKLTKLLYGPHGFLHEYVSSNWEYGALYTVLEFDILEKIPLDGEVHVSELAMLSGLPENKLLRILRLVACEQILEETSEQVFRHTVISEELVRNKKMKAWVGFQYATSIKQSHKPQADNQFPAARLFETRIASAHLADSLKHRNDFQTGSSAFKHAWGASMYDWHKAHPEKFTRFNLAMQGVTQSLDPGNGLFCDWFNSNKRNKHRNLVVYIGARDGHVYQYLAEQYPDISVEVQDNSEHLLTQGQKSLPPDLQPRITYTKRDIFTPQPAPSSPDNQTLAFILRNVLWNLSDSDAITLLRTFIPVLETSPETVILVNDMLSPARGEFDAQTEKAYRRRDVTVMTMHNAKQRTEGDWRQLFEAASPHFVVRAWTAFTSHAYRGLWEIKWVLAN